MNESWLCSLCNISRKCNFGTWTTWIAVPTARSHTSSANPLKASPKMQQTTGKRRCDYTDHVLTIYTLQRPLNSRQRKTTGPLMPTRSVKKRVNQTPHHQISPKHKQVQRQHIRHDGDYYDGARRQCRAFWTIFYHSSKENNFSIVCESEIINSGIHRYSQNVIRRREC